MNTQLNHIHNWQELAEKAEWKVAKLARLCGVSVRSLERYFRENLGMTPSKCLLENRHKKALSLLSNGCSAKEAASETGYKHPQHFSRAYKNFWGVSPAIETASPEEATSCRKMV